MASSPPSEIPPASPHAAGAAKSAPAARAPLWRRWLATPEASVLIVLLVLWVVMALVDPRFFSPQNRDNLSRAISVLSLFAIGELLVILTGGIDLSLGSLIAFSGMLLAVIATGMTEGGREPSSAWMAARIASAGPWLLGMGLVLGSIRPRLARRFGPTAANLTSTLLGLAVSALAWRGVGALALAMQRGGMPPVSASLIGVLLVVAFSLALGAVHAALVHYLRLPPFVVTLGSMSMLRSGAMLLNNSVPIPIEQFSWIIFLGNNKIYLTGTPIGIPVATLLLLAAGAVVAAILVLTRIGRRVYAAGSNEEATRLSGVDVFQVRLFAYATCSLLAGLAGILYAGYGSQGDPRGGVMFELNAISAVVIGGAALTGGRGSVVGTILGATLLESLVSMINFRLGDPTLWQGAVVGGVLLAAVVFNQIRQRRAQRAA